MKQFDWLEISSGHGILIYSAWQGLTLSGSLPYFCKIWRNLFDWFYICLQFCDIIANSKDPYQTING